MKIAIIGYYGHNNLGDELNLYEMMRLIRRDYENADITVFSGGLAQLFYKVDYNLVLADRMTLSEYRNTLNNFDIIIIGGGGLVFLGANYFDFLLEGIKVPYIFSRIGVDDRIISEEVCSELKGIMNRAYDVTVRTSFDREIAKKHLALDFNVVPEAIWNYKADIKEFLQPGKKIVVSVNGYSSNFEKNIKKSLQSLETNNTVYSVSMQDSSDDFYHNISSVPSNRIILPEAVSLHDKASFLASADLVITSRLHAGLIAISHGVPAVMMKSTPKVEFLMKELRLEAFYCENEQDFSTKFIESFFLNEHKIKEEIKSRTIKIKEAAKTYLIPK